ncbi:hypothetical protein [Pseudomonas sp. BRM28]|uniref:hypothetical protein n=1 Tax=Pseudomonas sp. BRM28 TaxID=2045201 RepID=UPI000CEED423|nr:hypothetical protein [Pseudomonas sp. BRM28]PPS59697.1 hypothetical protein CR917_01545 [Pseudomonas sp. BRM28]
MAVYIVENGQLKRVAEDLVRYSQVNWEEIGDPDQFLRKMGFFLQDDVELAYRRYQRVDGDRAVLPGIVHLFDVMAHDSTVDYILLDDHLGNYLAVMAMLSPLVAHALAVQAAAAAELARC